MENRRIKITNKPMWRFNTRLDGPEKRINEYKIEEMIDPSSKSMTFPYFTSLLISLLKVNFSLQATVLANSA